MAERELNSATIQVAAKTIAERQEALKWLEEYGVGLNGKDKDAASVTVHLNYASACRGSKEAQELLSAYGRFCLADMVDSAIRCCRNDIAIAKDQILREIDGVSNG